MSETDLQHEIKRYVEYLRNKGVKVKINRINTATFFPESKNGKKFKVASVDETGFPDMVGCYEGWFFAIECKSPGGRLSLNQKRVLDEYQRLGAFVAVCDNSEEFVSFFNDIQSGTHKDYLSYWHKSKLES